MPSIRTGSVSVRPTAGTPSPRTGKASAHDRWRDQGEPWAFPATRSQSAKLFADDVALRAFSLDSRFEAAII